MAKKSVSQQRAERAAAVAYILRTIETDLTTLQDDLSNVLTEAANGVLRSALAKIINNNLDKTTDISSLYDELEESRSNMEEKFSSTQRYQELEEKIQSLETVKDAVENFNMPGEVTGVEEIGELVETIGKLLDEVSEVAGELEGVEF